MTETGSVRVLLTRAELADAWAVLPQQIDRWCDEGKLIEGRDYVVTPGGHRRFRTSTMPPPASAS
jgi:hypothetical protein